MASLKEEFRMKCFGFIDFKAEDFARSQWNISRRKFLAYRAVVFFYWTIFLVVDFATNQDKSRFCLYLSHWNEAQLSLFFGFALFCAIRYMRKVPQEPTAGDKRSPNGRNSTNEPWILPLDSESATKLTAKIEGEQGSVTLPSSECETVAKIRLRWYHGLTTMMYVTSLSISVAVTILYATFEMSGVGDGEKRMSVGNFHLHFVNSLLIVADFFLNCIPIRLLHFIYVSIFTVLYCSFLFLLHITGVDSDLYRIVDWETNTLWAVAFSVGMVFLIAPATHSGMFFLQRGVRLLSSRSSRLARKDEEIVKEVFPRQLFVS